MKYSTMLAAFAAASALAGSAQATTTYDTNFLKDNNIYTNLNQQFPNTGAGVPGSETGVANATFLFNPTTYNPTNANNVNYVGNNGINFELTSNSTGQDFAQVGAGIGYASLDIPINVANATNVYVLAAAYNGTSANFTFTGSGGATETFSNTGLPDFNGGSTNSTSSTLNDQTVYEVLDTGAGGTGNSSNGAYNHYDLTELGFNLGSQFAGQTLDDVTVTSNGYETLVLGATTISPSVVSGVPEPSTWLLMLAGVGGAGLMLRARKRLGIGSTDFAQAVK